MLKTNFPTTANNHDIRWEQGRKTIMFGKLWWEHDILSIVDAWQQNCSVTF